MIKSRKEKEVGLSEEEKKITVYLDTLLDTLEEGRHSFLEISMFPELLKSSNPPLSAMMTCPDDCRV